ncbi:D-2-hydroxyacid dehydrogenase [Gracilibacillus xinjiangensis]|uniref:D-2-hydroxyacid dehydrogenase n=1 Tax=Gracilibacillus xinjiangensis TaxID=1193282 RepID=A0ABV8WW45_9BACI
MNIANIIFLSPINQELEVLLENYHINKKIRFLTEENLNGEDLEWADALVTFKTTSNYDYSKVKWVHSLGAGVDNFTFHNEWKDDVILTRTITSFGQRISEYCLSYILKDIQFHEQFQYQKSIKLWKPITPKMLNEVCVLIYGTGEIGQKIAEVLTGFGVKVYGVSRSGKQKDHFADILTIDSHYSLLSQVDYVINTLPLTEKTENLFHAGIFDHYSSIGFINVGRGESVKEKDLLQAITRNQVRFAVIDVFANEPLPEDHVFWEHPKIFLTPHISAVTTAKEAAECFVETLENIEKNKPLPNRVDVKQGY